MAKKKDAQPPSPDKLVRDRPRQYHTADGRFDVQAEATGSWYLTDSEHTNELGLPRLLGPFATLDEVREAISEAREARSAPSGQRPRLRLVQSTTKPETPSTDDADDEAPEAADASDDAADAAAAAADASDEADAPARPAHAAARAGRAATRGPASTRDHAPGPVLTRATRAPAKLSKPPKGSWLDRLEPRERTVARKLIAGLEAVGIPDPEPIVRADLGASLPRVAPAVLLAELWAEDLASWADDAWVEESAGGRPPRGVRRDGAEALERMLEAGAQPVDLVAVARMVAARTAGLVLGRVTLGGRGRGSRRQLPSWRLVEIGTDGEPTGRSILLSEDDVIRAAPATVADDD